MDIWLNSAGTPFFSSNHKERQCQRLFKLPHNCTHLTHLQSNAQNSTSQASIVCEPRKLPDVQTGFRKGRGTRDQIANIHWIIEKVREFQKNIYFCFIDYAKAFDCVDHNKLSKILQELGIPDHLTCLLRNLYAGQEATVRTRHGNNRLVPNWERSTSRFCHSAYLTYMQSTLCEMPGWMKHKLESRLLEEISRTSDMQMIPPFWPKAMKN